MRSVMNILAANAWTPPPFSLAHIARAGQEGRAPSGRPSFDNLLHILGMPAHARTSRARGIRLSPSDIHIRIHIHVRIHIPIPYTRTRVPRPGTRTRTHDRSTTCSLVLRLSCASGNETRPRVAVLEGSRRIEDQDWFNIVRLGTMLVSVTVVCRSVT